MPSRHRPEGYLLIDNRHAPPVDLETAARSGREVIGAGVSGVFEAATQTCSHCTATVVMNPDRTRPRGYCRSCDAYVCDTCVGIMAAPGYVHVSFRERYDRAVEAAERGLPVGDLTRG